MTASPGPRIVRAADFLLIGAALFALMVCVFLLGRQVYFSVLTLQGIAMATTLAVLGIFLFLSRRRSAETRIWLALSLILTVLAAYAVEAVLTHPAIPAVETRKQKSAQRAGRAFDFRSPSQVLAGLRAQGVDAYPSIFPRRMLEPQADIPGLHSPLHFNDGAEVIPLAGVSSATIVHCNESGRYSIYESDELGFRNPRESWSGYFIDLALIGDSFLQGDCVDPGEDAASGLRKAWPHTVTLGMRNNGPLLDLAGIREFLLNRRPARLAWFFYEGNDFQDLDAEKSAPILMRYLEEPGFRQNLEARGSELNLVLRQHLDSLLATQGRIEPHHSTPGQSLFIDWLLLRSTRALLGLSVADKGLSGSDLLKQRIPQLAALFSPNLAGSAEAQDDLILFERILKAAQDDVTGWGGHMVLIYLPDPARLCAGLGDWQDDCPSELNIEKLERRRANVRALAQRLQLPMVDLAAGLDQTPQPEKLYLYYGSHFSAQGYGWLAGQVESYFKSLH